MTSRSIGCAGPLALMFAYSGVGATCAQTFDLMGYDGRILCRTTGMSADGSIAAGDSGGYGYTWTRAGGRYDFGGAAEFSHRASGVGGMSGDGQWVVGRGSDNGAVRAYRWRTDHTLQILGTIGSWAESVATSASNDASVVVGRVQGQNSDHAQAFRWSQAGGMQGLGYTRPETEYHSEARAVSRDGGTIVGDSWGQFADAFVWTAEEGMTRLQPYSGRPDDGVAYGTNFNGNIVVGQSGNGAVVWIDRVVADLGSLQLGWGSNEARAVCDDGSIIVGSGQLGGHSTAWAWTAATGLIPLTDYLAINGVSVPAGWVLSQALCISADGKTIAGWATSSTGESLGFVATVPAPGALMFVGVGGVLGCYRRRR